MKKDLKKKRTVRRIQVGERVRMYGGYTGWFIGRKYAGVFMEVNNDDGKWNPQSYMNELPVGYVFHTANPAILTGTYIRRVKVVIHKAPPESLGYKTYKNSRKDRMRVGDHWIESVDKKV